MIDVQDALGAIVDYNFDRNFSRTVAKAVGTRSYAEAPESVEMKLEMLNSIVEGSGLSSVDHSLGGHPDFNHLEGELTEDSTITTLFADLRNFTRYGLFFSPKEIRYIKKAVISSFIHIVHAYDGHVHNIPGDGLMVYFGGKNRDDEEMALNAVMSGASLLYALDRYINPILQEQYGFEERLHMRVGVEYGNVLWGQYGTKKVVEVKATGFSVDFAAKIQQVAETDKMRVGQGITDLLDWPDTFYSDTQTYEKQLKHVRKQAKHYQFDWANAIRSYSSLIKAPSQGEMEDAVPNHAADGYDYVNSRMPSIIQRALPTSNQYRMTMKTQISPKRSGPFREIYSGQRKLPKDWWLKFTVSHDVPEPYEVEWEVVNNGYEAFTVGGKGDLGHVIVGSTRKNVAYEHTAYTGTHYMVCRIIKDEREVARALQPVIVR